MARKIKEWKAFERLSRKNGVELRAYDTEPDRILTIGGTLLRVDDPRLSGPIWLVLYVSGRTQMTGSEWQSFDAVVEAYIQARAA